MRSGTLRSASIASPASVTVARCNMKHAKVRCRVRPGQRIVAADIASAVVTFRPHQRTSRCGLSAGGGSKVINKQVEKRPGALSEQ
jgi:hypothetical protein